MQQWCQSCSISISSEEMKSMIILKSGWNQKHDSPEINSWSFSHITHEIKAWNLHDADVFIFPGSRQGDQNWPKWSHRLFLFAYSPKFLSFLSIFICASFRHFDTRLFDIRHLKQLAILTHGFLLKPSQPPQGYFWNLIDVYVFKLSSELLNTISDSTPSLCKCIFSSFEQMSGDTFRRISTNLLFALMPQASRTNIKFVVLDWGQRRVVPDIYSKTAKDHSPAVSISVLPWYLP